jgi:hypothetical protein
LNLLKFIIKKISQAKFIAGNVILKTFDADTHIATFQINWNTLLSKKIENVPKNIIITKKISNQVVKTIFSNIGNSVPLYVILQLKEKKLHITKIYLPQSIEISHLLKLKISDSLSLNTQSKKQSWNTEIYQGKRSYSKHGKNSIKDNLTGLIWQQKGSDNTMTWTSAKSYCKKQSTDGYNDWRLPTMKELYYLGDVNKYNPAIDASFEVQSSVYWTATSYKNDASSAWVVYFNFGDGNWDDKSFKFYALCVRGEQGE